MSKKILFLTLLFVFSVFSVTAQYQPNVVFWSENAECGSKRLVVDQIFTCSAKTELRKDDIKVLENENLRIQVRFLVFQGRIRASTIIENKSASPLQFDPVDWTMAQYSDKNMFLAGSQPLYNEMSLKSKSRPGGLLPTFSNMGTGIPADPVISQTTTQGSDRTVATGPVRQGPLQQQTVITPGQNTQVSTVDMPRPIIPNTIRLPNGAIGRIVKSEFKINPLKKRTLGKNKKASGYLDFADSLSSRYGLYFLTVGDTTFVFEVSKHIPRPTTQ